MSQTTNYKKIIYISIKISTSNMFNKSTCFCTMFALKLGYTISKIVHYEYPRLDAGYGYIVQS